MWYDEMFEKMEEEKDEEQAAKMSAYMKNQFPFLGLPKPKLTKLMQPYMKLAIKAESVDWNFIFLCWEKDYRESQYVGVEYIYKSQKKFTERDLDNLKKLIVTKSWWDVTDSLDRVVGMLSQKYPSIQEEMLVWSESDNIWLRRVAIDYQLQFKEKTNVEQLEKIIVNNLGTNEFFINKAIGWSLREYSKVNPEWVASFLKKYEKRLAPLSIREASKYI